MPVRISNHRKVTHHATDIHGQLNQNILLPGLRGYAIDFFATIALKAEVIQTGFNFILNDDQNEDRIFACLGGRSQPDIVPALEAAITHDRETAERSVEID